MKKLLLGILFALAFSATNIKDAAAVPSPSWHFGTDPDQTYTASYQKEDYNVYIPFSVAGLMPNEVINGLYIPVAYIGTDTDDWDTTYESYYYLGHGNGYIGNGFIIYGPGGDYLPAGIFNPIFNGVSPYLSVYNTETHTDAQYFPDNSFLITITGQQNTVPEPATMALVCIGGAAMAFARRKKKSII